MYTSSISDYGNPLGVESGDILDNQFSSSSASLSSFEPFKARLNSPSAWCMAENSLSDFLQIDLLVLHVIQQVCLDWLVKWLAKGVFHLSDLAGQTTGFENGIMPLAMFDLFVQSMCICYTLLLRILWRISKKGLIYIITLSHCHQFTFIGLAGNLEQMKAPVDS